MTLAEKRQIILEEKRNVWGAKEIADGTVAVGYNDTAEVNIYVDAKVTRTFTMPNIAAFGFILLPDWDPLWSPKISKEQTQFLAIDAHKVALIDLAKKDHEVAKIYGIDIGMLPMHQCFCW